MPGMFAGIKEAALQQRLNQRLWGLFVELMQIIKNMLGEIDEQELLERIFQNDQARELFARLLNDPDQNNIAA